jgi:hypothetical protein
MQALYLIGDQSYCFQLAIPSFLRFLHLRSEAQRTAKLPIAMIDMTLQLLHRNTASSTGHLASALLPNSCAYGFGLSTYKIIID